MFVEAFAAQMIPVYELFHFVVSRISYDLSARERQKTDNERTAHSRFPSRSYRCFQPSSEHPQAIGLTFGLSRKKFVGS